MKSKKEMRHKRKLKFAVKIRGTALRPRLSVFRSNQAFYAQLIDDSKAVTLISGNIKKPNCGNARTLGRQIAKKALDKKIVKVVFDRAGYRFHGAVKTFADAAREGGLKF